MTHFVLLLAVLPVLCVGCANSPNSADGTLDLPGPTRASRSAEGYVLENRHVRLVIDDQTGDVVQWTRATAVIGPGFEVSARGAGPDPMDGHVEPRDEQTWEYIGADRAAGLGWRKIYCLDGDDLDASFLVQNLGSTPRGVRMVLRSSPALTGVRFSNSDAVVVAYPDGTTASFQSFNETHGLVVDPADLLRSDDSTLKPSERISWTTRWRIEPASR